MKYRLFTLVALTLALTNLPPTPAAAQTRPNGLPNHFGFGIEAGKGDTGMPESHIAWDFRRRGTASGSPTPAAPIPGRAGRPGGRTAPSRSTTRSSRIGAA